MREIRFRAWDKINEEMIPWGRLLNGYNLRNVFMGPEMCGLILMQFTGLKDKNGVEIFEGDYVVGVQYLTTSPNVPFEIKGVVRYSERNTMFYFGDKEKGHEIFMQSLGSAPYILEVIGNIYENSDLLEVSE